MNLDEAALARNARELRARYGQDEAVKIAQRWRDEHAGVSASQAFWSRVIAQLLLLERPAPEHADPKPGDAEADAAYFESRGLVLEPLPEPSAPSTGAPAPLEPEQGSLF